jgi:glycosyltransferase involved in cell wall biosynthesis
MGKQKKYYPFVSVCTPTFNRRPFIENMFQCFRNQNYPKDRIEWIIVDDGTDKIGDLIAKSKIPQIKYFTLPEKVPLGTKRNFMHKHAKGTIIVYMDDDDYYPPDRISHAVERLESNKDALCAGSSEIYIYFKTLNRMVQCGPYGPKHATAGTFAFRAELLKQTQYEDHAALAEERAFLKDYTVPFVQLDPMKTILVFSHEHNTFDKRKMLENPHPDFLKDSPKTVDDFIKNKNEEGIKDFFMNQIDKLLENYEAGSPKMKPDVLEQIKKIEAERAEMLRKAEEQQRAMGGNQIILQKDGESPQVLTAQDAVNIMQQQQQYIGELQHKNAEKEKRIKDLENMVLQLQTQIIQKNKQNNQVSTVSPPSAEILVKDGTDIINIAPQDTNEMPKSTPLITVESD